jgi:HK97 family phage major capsid protein
MGPTVLSGLQGNVAIPRQISATTTYWVTEASAITQAEATFDQVTMTPKQLGARSQYSRLMLQQSTPDIETIVRNDLARVMALGMDSAAISGSGASGQPRGILNTSSIGSVAMGTNGAALVNAATSGTTGLDQIFLLERAVDVANALVLEFAYWFVHQVLEIVAIRAVVDVIALVLEVVALCFTSDGNRRYRCRCCCH